MVIRLPIIAEEPEGKRLQCLSCEREETFSTGSEVAGRELARKQGWHVVTFVRHDPVTRRNKEVFITFCPPCANPANAEP